MFGAAAGRGSTGNTGWSPALSVVADGARRVLQVSDWMGGTGEKAPAGDYIGAAGLTSIIGDAIDIRGAAGLAGANAIGPPNALTPAFGTAYQATDPTRPAMITCMIETIYSITVASTQSDTVEIRIGSNQTTVANGSSGSAVGVFKTSLTGITLAIGMGTTNRNPLTAYLPAQWYFAVRRVAGSTATITSAFDQAVG